MDQGLLHWVTNADGERVEAWAYGGDFGEPVHDAQFCINGLVFPNRVPHPACHECKAVMVRAWPAPRAASPRASSAPAPLQRHCADFWLIRVPVIVNLRAESRRPDLFC